jgi:hypothetical protein
MLGSSRRSFREVAGRGDVGQRWLEGGAVKKVTAPLERREVIAHLTTKGLSERAACAWSGWSRQVSLYEPAKALSDAQLVEQMKRMSLLHPRACGPNGPSGIGALR